MTGVGDVYRKKEEDVIGTMKLISAEGFEFVIDKKAAMVSYTMSRLLTSPGQFLELQTDVVRFPEIRAVILEKICQYFYWSLQYRKRVKVTELQIDPELTFELMMAANYLYA